MLARRVAAEALGTFAPSSSAPARSWSRRRAEPSVSWGSRSPSGSITTMIYALGHISGAHLNPAVSFGFALSRHFPWSRVGAYWVAQCAGAIAAALLLRASLGDIADVGATQPSGSNAQSFLWEVVLTFFLMLVIMAVATDTRAVGEAAAIAVGGTVALGALVGGPVSGASMNPARSLGPALAAGELNALWIYLLAPLLGAALGAVAYQFLRGERARAQRSGARPSDAVSSILRSSRAGRRKALAAGSAGMRALTIAPWMPSVTSCVKDTLTSSKPAASRPASYSPMESAPAMQPAKSPRSRRSSGLRRSSATTSVIPIRPPGRRTRAISVRTAGLSAERLMTQLEMTTSTESAGRDRLDQTLEEVDVGDPRLSRVLLREREHLVGHVEAVGGSGRADTLRGEDDVDAAAGAEVEHDLALVQVGNGGGVAAAQAGECGCIRKLPRSSDE